MVAFVSRHVTRAADKCTEIEESVSVEEFEQNLSAGVYALFWDAHDTRYGIPKTALEIGLSEGQRLVLNVSRTIIDDVLLTYGKERGIEATRLGGG